MKIKLLMSRIISCIILTKGAVDDTILKKYRNLNHIMIIAIDSNCLTVLISLSEKIISTIEMLRMRDIMSSQAQSLVKKEIPEKRILLTIMYTK